MLDRLTDAKQHFSAAQEDGEKTLEGGQFKDIKADPAQAGHTFLLSCTQRNYPWDQPGFYCCRSRRPLQRELAAHIFVVLV